MTPLDLLWAAGQSRTLWPDSEVRGTADGNLEAVVNDSVVGQINFRDVSVTDVTTGARYVRD